MILLGLQITAVLGLALAWRWDLFGGALSLVTMLTSMILFVVFRQNLPTQAALIWIGFIVLPAALFLYCGVRLQAADKPTNQGTAA